MHSYELKDRERLPKNICCKITAHINNIPVQIMLILLHINALLLVLIASIVIICKSLWIKVSAK